VAAGTQRGALEMTMIIADETDAAAVAKWEHYKTGTDHEGIAWRESQFADNPTSDPLADPNKAAARWAHRGCPRKGAY
jgi:pyrimidine oxygenase